MPGEQSEKKSDEVETNETESAFVSWQWWLEKKLESRTIAATATWSDR